MADKKDPKSPATTSYAYDAMLPAWQKMETLLEGTAAMRAAGKEYLPQHAEESDEAYGERLEKATLLNVVQMTLDGWVGKPFSDPITIGDDVPEPLKALFKNIDLQGNSLDTFSRFWFREGVAKSFSHVLVDFPRALPREDGLPRSLADDKAENLRPYMVHIKPENLIFAYAQIVDGVERLTHVRIMEETIEMVGFAETCQRRIRQIEPGLVKIFKETLDSKRKPIWILESEYTMTLQYVPLVTFYAARKEFMYAKPPLLDLADLNISHWQSTSDQIAVLTVARFPILAVSGAVSDDELRVGPMAWLNCPDPAGRFYYVEHAGKAIAAGRTQLQDLEETMAEYGATFLKKRPGGASATARALDTAEMTSPLQDMAIRFVGALQQALKFMADWMKLEVGGTVEINLEFGLTDGDSVKLAAAVDARTNKDISRKRYLNELKRMGVLADDFDYEKNEKELSTEKSYLVAGVDIPLPAPKIPANPDRPAQ